MDFCRGASHESFLMDARTQWAVWAQIVIMGEASRRIPDDWRKRHPAVPWAEIAGMRNHLVHGYDVIDWDRVWRVVSEKLPQLVAELESMIPRSD